MKRLMPLTLGLLLSAAGLPAAAQSSSGGWTLEAAAQPSASPRVSAISEDVTSPRQPYAFVPIGGNVYDDVFLQNFVDLDAPPDLLDFTGGSFTQPGQTGEDVLLRSFAEQDLGVPVFAALDGTASQAVYSDTNDRNTTGSSAGLGNYVILDHGAGQQTGYFSLVHSDSASPDPRYAPVSVGEAVRAGTQIGLAGSSGASTAPHFHLQSSLNGTIYEPFAGSARPGLSWWTAQPAVRRDTYLEVFNVDGGDVNSPPTPSSDLPRQGTFVQGATNMGGWTILHNLPANSTYRLRWLRPDGTVYHDTAAVNFTFSGSTSFQRTVEYYWNYVWMPGLDQTGTWHLELTVNGSLVQAAPFFVVASAGLAVNHPPYSVSLTLDPAQPTASDAIFCRVSTAPGQDGAPVVVSPDSALVHYHYVWSVISGGTSRVVRDVTSAGHADAIPWGQGNVGDSVACTVTPIDSRGLTNNGVAGAGATLLSRTSAGIAVGPNNTPRLLWGNPSGIASLWSINPDGSHTYTTYGPYTDNAPENKWAPKAISVAPDNTVHLLWGNTDGRMAFWGVDGQGNVLNVTGYGPYTGSGNLWSVTGLATGADGISRVLWNNPSGRVALWTLDGQGNVLSVTGYGPYTDNGTSNLWSAVGVSVGPDNVTHLLWSNTDGRMAFWGVDGQGNVLNVTGYGPYTGSGNLWSVTGLATGADGISRVLWNNPSGRVALWTLDGQGNVLSVTGYGPYDGFTASAIGVGPNSNPRIAWTGTNGQAIVWNIDMSGNVTRSAYGL